MAILVHAIKFYICIIINRPSRQKVAMVWVLTSLIFKKFELGFRKYMSTKIPSIVHQGLLVP